MDSARNIERPYDSWKAGKGSDPFGDRPRQERQAEPLRKPCHGCDRNTRSVLLRWVDGASLCPDCVEEEGWRACSHCGGLFPHAEWTEIKGRIYCVSVCAPYAVDLRDAVSFAEDV